MAQMQPRSETGLGEHVPGVAPFLASKDSRFVAGRSLIVDGGR
jgi:NAD(P)-dependent dehydrogenase (short-subunit alcohol dehydrogenase family)